MCDTHLLARQGESIAQKGEQANSFARGSATSAVNGRRCRRNEGRHRKPEDALLVRGADEEKRILPRLRKAGRVRMPRRNATLQAVDQGPHTVRGGSLARIIHESLMSPSPAPSPVEGEGSILRSLSPMRERDRVRGPFRRAKRVQE